MHTINLISRDASRRSKAHRIITLLKEGFDNPTVAAEVGDKTGNYVAKVKSMAKKSGLLRSTGPVEENLGGMDVDFDNALTMIGIYPRGKKHSATATSEGKKQDASKISENPRIENVKTSAYSDKPVWFIYDQFSKGVSGPELIKINNFDPTFILEEHRKFHEMNGMPLKLIEPVLDMILSASGPIIRTRVMLIKTRRRKFVTYDELADLVYSAFLEHGNVSQKHVPVEQDPFHRISNPIGIPAGYP